MTPTDPKGANTVARRLVRADTNQLFFDHRPIDIGPFKLSARGVKTTGKPTIEEWATALNFACECHEASPYWVGDLVAYGENRQDWAEKLSQAQSVSGLSIDRLHDLGYVSRRTGATARRVSPSIEHSRAAARVVDEGERLEWLRRSREEGWSVRELRLEIKAASRAKVIEGQAVLEGLHRVLYADFPWGYSNRPPSGTGQAEKYHGMTVEQGIAMGPGIQAHLVKDAVAFFWVTAPFLYYATDPEKGPDAYRILRAWGFTPKTGRVWDKVEHNWGNYISIRHEHLIIATRGKHCTPDRPTPMLDSVVTERQEDEHSGKPESFRKDIERLYDGPYLELFGRKPVEGWTVWGNDCRLWPTHPAADVTT